MEQIDKRLENSAPASYNKQAYIIQYRGEHIMMNSGKSIFHSPNEARLALYLHLDDDIINYAMDDPDNYNERIRTAKQYINTLINEGVVDITKLSVKEG